VDCLIRGGIVLTIDDDGSLWEPGYVAVRGGIIIETGVFDPSVEARLCPKEVLDATGCVIMPGLINCHTHAAMTLFRGLADDMPLMKWLQEHIFPAEKKLKEEWVYWGTKLACAEMIMAGTTCFCDMYLFEQAVARAADEAGMRAIIGEVLYDFLSPNYGPLENGLGFTDALIREWKYHPRIRAVVEPHAVYTCSPDTLRQCLDLAEKHDVPMIVHLSETEDEVMECLKRYGRRPVQHLAHLGLLSPRLIAAHCVELDERDISALARNGVTVVHNPESNLKLGSGIAPVPELLRCGVRVVLGTDGCASNNDLDMFGEMNTCAKLHKAVWLDPTVLPATDVLAMATRKAGKALGMAWDVPIGMIESGCVADLIIVDLEKPHLIPCYNPVSHMVYTARGSDVRDVMIDGRWVLRNRELITIDLDEVRHQVSKIAAQIIRC